MNQLDQEYAIFSSNYGDGTPPSFEDWKAAREGQTQDSRFKLTAEDVEYIQYTNGRGDGTELSFEDWKKAGKPAL